MTSPSAASEDAPGSDQTRDSSSAVESSDGESSISEEVQSGSGEHGAPQVHTRDQKQTGRKVKSRVTEKLRREEVKKKKEYLKLFNDSAEEESTYGRIYGKPLEDSRLGLSYWSVDEKELFFTALARHGRVDLPALSKAVGPKRECDMQSYILSLEKGVQDRIEATSDRNPFSRADVPAACEVGSECGDALNQAAYALAIQTEKDQVAAEKRKFGGRWLIDTPTADEINTLLDADQDSSQHNADTQSLLTPSTTFFDAAVFLQLSRNLFMNGPADGHWNHRTSSLLDHTFLMDFKGNDLNSDAETPDEEASYEPSIYRSALNDLNDLTQNLTQKLVYATLFQASSRLRAKDNDAPPMATVLASDVHVAADLLGLRQDWKTYWAKLPRRAGLEVYSESDKYKPGRKGTKNGVQLTYEEVEKEMGLKQSATPSARKTGKGPDRLNSTHESAHMCSCDESTNAEDSDVSSDGIIEVQLERERRKRRRRLSPDSFARTEERYMQALDRRTDREEDDRLREMLGLEGREDVAEESDVPERPKLKKQFRGEMRRDWRKDTETIAAWEVECANGLMTRHDESADDEDGDEPEDSDSSGSTASNEALDYGIADESQRESSDDEMANEE